MKGVRSRDGGNIWGMKSSECKAPGLEAQCHSQPQEPPGPRRGQRSEEQAKLKLMASEQRGSGL